jgi:signal transduction histidine kinase
MASRFMLDASELAETDRTLTTRIAHSASRMQRMVNDLLDFARSRLGSGVPILRREMDLAAEAAHAVHEIAVAHPRSVLRLETSGDLVGAWDAARVGQMLTNLIGNAVHHGSTSTPITVSARGLPAAVELQVHNGGAAIPPGDLPGLFSAYKRIGKDTARVGSPTSLGLGLYIAERIATAHGGTIAVTSTDRDGTTFTVGLPR